MVTQIEKAWQLVEAGDVSAIMRHLRFIAEDIPLTELARVMERVSAMAGFDDLGSAAALVDMVPDSAEALFKFGYACVDHGASYVAIPALAEALRLAPDVPVVLTELVTALEDEWRHGEAVALLEQRDDRLRDWPDRYLLVFNAVMTGDLDRARRHVALLSAPDDPQWTAAYQRANRMLARADTAGMVATLDGQDLRGWHFVLTGGVLASLSPYGFKAGMTGRYAFLQEGMDNCRRGVHRLQVILEAAGSRPRTVSPLPDRSSQVLGTAAARLLDLPIKPFKPGRTDTLIVAHDLKHTDEAVPTTLYDRADGQILFEHSTCWTNPPAVSADISGLLVQHSVAPWAKQFRVDRDGKSYQAPADDRPVPVLADEILGTGPAPDPGDGDTPPDTDESITSFVAGIRDQWLHGPREGVRSPGPVPSSRFL